MSFAEFAKWVIRKNAVFLSIRNNSPYKLVQSRTITGLNRRSDLGGMGLEEGVDSLITFLPLLSCKVFDFECPTCWCSGLQAKGNL